jgi:hypothetical protein
VAFATPPVNHISLLGVHSYLGSRSAQADHGPFAAASAAVAARLLIGQCLSAKPAASTSASITVVYKQRDAIGLSSALQLLVKGVRQSAGSSLDIQMDDDLDQGTGLRTILVRINGSFEDYEDRVREICSHILQHHRTRRDFEISVFPEQLRPDLSGRLLHVTDEQSSIRTSSATLSRTASVLDSLTMCAACRLSLLGLPCFALPRPKLSEPPQTSSPRCNAHPRTASPCWTRRFRFW